MSEPPRTARTAEWTVAPLVLIGGGGHALVVAEAALAAGLVVEGFLDDDVGAVLGSGPPGPRRLGALGEAGVLDGRGWLLALGDVGRRRVWLDAHGSRPGAGHEEGSAGGRGAIILHPRALVSPSAGVGAGAFVGAMAVIHARARIGAHAILNTGCIVEHECVLAENIHIAPGAVLGGRVTVGRDTLVGLGARVLPGVRIGSGCTVGAGAVVTADVADGMRVAGVPASAI